MALSKDRDGRLTASRHGQALGFGYDSAPQDWRKWNGLEAHDEAALARMEWGTAHEDIGIAAIEAALGVVVDCHGDNQLWTPWEDWSGCTTDGLIDEDSLCEVKAPQVCYQEPPKAHYCQVQSQLFFTKRRKGYLVCWTPEKTAIWETFADVRYWPTVEPHLIQYMTMLNAPQPPQRWKKPKLNLDFQWERVK